MPLRSMFRWGFLLAQLSHGANAAHMADSSSGDEACALQLQSQGSASASTALHIKEEELCAESPNPAYGVFEDPCCENLEGPGCDGKTSVGCAAGGLPQGCRYCFLPGSDLNDGSLPECPGSDEAGGPLPSSSACPVALPTRGDDCGSFPPTCYYDLMCSFLGIAQYKNMAVCRQGKWMIVKVDPDCPRGSLLQEGEEEELCAESPNPAYGVFEDACCEDLEGPGCDGKTSVGCAAGGLPQSCRYCFLPGSDLNDGSLPECPGSDEAGGPLPTSECPADLPIWDVKCEKSSTVCKYNPLSCDPPAEPPMYEDEATCEFGHWLVRKPLKKCP